MGVCLLARLQHVAMRRLATINDVATGYFSSYTEVSIVCVLWNMDIILSTVGLNFGTKNCTDLQTVTGRIVWCSRTRWYGVVRTAVSTRNVRFVLQEQFSLTGHFVESVAKVVALYTQGEVTSPSLWSRYDRHFVGITRYTAWS